MDAKTWSNIKKMLSVHATHKIITWTLLKLWQISRHFCDAIFMTLFLVTFCKYFHNFWRRCRSSVCNQFVTVQTSVFRSSVRLVSSSLLGNIDWKYIWLCSVWLPFTQREFGVDLLPSVLCFTPIFAISDRGKNSPYQLRMPTCKANTVEMVSWWPLQ